MEVLQITNNWDLRLLLNLAIWPFVNDRQNQIGTKMKHYIILCIYYNHNEEYGSMMNHMPCFWMEWKWKHSWSNFFNIYQQYNFASQVLIDSWSVHLRLSINVQTLQHQMKCQHCAITKPQTGHKGQSIIFPNVMRQDVVANQICLVILIWFIKHSLYRSCVTTSICHFKTSLPSWVALFSKQRSGWKNPLASQNEYIL